MKMFALTDTSGVTSVIDAGFCCESAERHRSGLRKTGSDAPHGHMLQVQTKSQVLGHESKSRFIYCCNQHSIILCILEHSFALFEGFKA